MKPTLQFRLSQHLTLTPQLQQSIRLLQLSTIELNQEIERLLMENPILEREDGESDAAAADRGRAAVARGADARASERGAGRGARPRATTERRAPSCRPTTPRPGAAPRTAATTRATATQAAPDLPTLRDHLNSELALTNLGARDRALVGLLIDALDDDGYLTQSLEEIAALMPPEAEVERRGAGDRALAPAEPRAGRRGRAHARRMPGAADPRAAEAMPVPTRALALAICEQHLELLASRDYVRLKNAHRRRRRSAARRAAADPRPAIRSRAPPSPGSRRATWCPT